MRKYVLFAITLVFATGCASGVKKSFTIMADPSDARIKVVSGKNQKTQNFRSSDRITVHDINIVYNIEMNKWGKDNNLRLNILDLSTTN